MPQIYHQSVEEIISNATPAQRLIWNDLFLRFGERISINQYSFIGASAGHEILTYVPRKLFFAYEIEGGDNSPSGVVQSMATFMDENNVVSYVNMVPAPYWDATAAAVRYGRVVIKQTNIVFSRCSLNNMPYIKIHGFRIGF